MQHILVRSLVLFGWGGALLGGCTRSGFQQPPVNPTRDAAAPVVDLDASAWGVDGLLPDQVGTTDVLALDSQTLDDGPAADGAGAPDRSAVDAFDAAVEDTRDGALDDRQDGALGGAQDAAREDVHDAATEDAHAACGAGYHDGGDGSCVPAGTCSPGFHDGGDLTCLPEGSCIPGYHDGGDGACMPEGTCILGHHDGGDGRCVLDGSCSATFHDDGCGVCVSSGCCADHVEDPPGACTLAPLAPPTLLDPPDSWPVATTTPTLRWSALTSSAPVLYDVVLSSGPDCSGDRLRVDGLAEAWLALTAADGLSLGTTSYWCVRASDGLHPTSAWSAPWRLPLRGLRVRVREGRPVPEVGWTPQVPALVDEPAAAIVLPLGADSWGLHLLGYSWTLASRSERWSLQRSAAAGAAPSAGIIDDAVPDPARGDAVGSLALSDDSGPTGAWQRGLWRYDLDSRRWSPLAEQSVDGGPPRDGGVNADAASSSSLAADPDADRTLLTRASWWPPALQMLALDRGSDPPTLRELGPQSLLPGVGHSDVLHPIASSTTFLHLGSDGAGLPVTSLFDVVTEAWQAIAASTPRDAVIHDVPALASPLLLGGELGELRTWNGAARSWDPWAPASATPLHWPFARRGLWLETRATYWSAAGGTGQSEFGPAALAALAIEPDAWPVLTLVDSATGSPDGTSSLDVEVRVAGDDEATAWLLGDDENPPAADDPRWQQARPGAHRLGATAGLHQVNLWLRYPHGGVGPVPGRASIWYLPSAPAAPTISVHGQRVDGSLEADASENGMVAVSLEAPLDGIVGFFAAVDPAPPTLAQFRDSLAPVLRLSLKAISGPADVHAWVLDAAGQISPATTREVLYRDVLAPVLRFGEDTAHAVVSAQSPVVSWTVSDLSPPVTVDLRISSAADDCSGDVLAVDGISGTAYTFDPDLLLPGEPYTVCIRGHDAWVPANSSDWVRTRIAFQRTAARWHALAGLPTDLGYGSAIAYDTRRSHILLFGGFYASNYRAGVHVYDSVANTWSLATVSGTPPHGRGGAMALYDEARDRLVVTGGFYNTGSMQYPQDTWALDLSSMTWSQLSTSGAPPRRSFAATLHDDARDRWLVGHYTIWTADTVHDPMLFDLATRSWTTAPAFVGYSYGTGNLIAALAPDSPLVIEATALHTLDLAAVTSTPRAGLTGVSSYSELAAARDDSSGLLVQYPEYIGSAASQTRRTLLLDAQSGLRLRSDAANIPDRGLFGMIRDPVRRSVVMVGGYTRHGDPWVQTYDVNEFRHHGGPRVFAADPGTRSELEFAGSSVDLAVDWDEGATAWLVNEVAWPPPLPTDPGWVGARPTAYTFSSSSPGPRSVYVWIQGADSLVVEDPGRWELTCTGP
jgi:hypothetical protein